MELVFPPKAPNIAHALIRRAAKTARDAGGSQLDFVVTPSYPHTAMLKRAGFLAAPSDVYLRAYGRGREETPLDLWQLVPGDQDTL